MSKVLILIAGSLLLLAFAVFVPDGKSSLAQDNGPELIVYSGTNFTGRSHVITSTSPDMQKETADDGDEFDWNDRVRSLKVVRGTWRLYQHGRCNTVIDETLPEDLDVSTKPPARGWSCLVSANSRGTVEYSSSLRAAWDDGISSIELVSERNLPDWAIKR